MTPAETQALADGVAEVIKRIVGPLKIQIDQQTAQIKQLETRLLELEAARAAAEPVRA